jgi:AcrR family transcriptional regulator
MTQSADPIDMKLLHLAEEHVRRHGLAKTTVVGIAQEANMSHANVYRYFATKSVLIDAVIAQWLKPLELSLRDIADGPDPAYDKIEHICAVIYRNYRDKLEKDPHWFAIFAAATEKERGVARKHRSRIRDAIQRSGEDGVGSSLFTAGNRRQLVAFVFDAFHRFIHPVSIRLDAEIPRHEMNLRFDRVADAALRAMGSRIIK